MSGEHRLEGVIVAVGPNAKPFESQPAPIDLAPTLVAALDVPTAVTPKGRILHEVVGSEKALTSRESTVQIPTTEHSRTQRVSCPELAVGG